MSGHQVTLSSVLWFGRIHKEGCALECEDTNLSKVSLYFSFPFYVYHFFSSFELAFVDVYTNDISSSSLFGCLNHGQTKCTEAKNRNGLLRLHLRRIENGTPPSGNSAAFFYGNGKYWIKFSINWIINLNHFYLRDTSCSNQLQDGFWQQIFQQWLHIQRMLNIPKTQELKWFKSRALSEIRYHEMEDLPSILGKTGSSVRHKALSLSCSNLRAKVGLVTLAKNAFLLTAFRGCANNDRSRKWVHI